VRFHPDALMKELEFLPNSREEFMAMRYGYGATDIQKAAVWIYVRKNSFGGKGGPAGYGTQKKSGGTSNASRLNRMDAIAAANRRLDAVNIEHLDWRECLTKYDGPETLFFVDPPYMDGAQKYYADTFSPRDHEELKDALMALTGQWILTLSDTPTARRLYAGCPTEEAARALGIDNRNGARRQYTELIIFKPEAAPCPTSPNA